MCTGIELAIIGSTALAAGGQIMSGIQTSQAASMNAELAERDANEERVAAAEQAKRIRRAGRSQISQANAALAASGVDLASDTAVRIGETITRDSELDAYNVLLTGRRRADTRLGEAAISRSEGRTALTSGLINAAGTAAQGGYNWIRRPQAGA